MQTHGPESNWGHAILLQRNTALQDCHPPYARTHKNNTYMHRKTQLLSLRGGKNPQHHPHKCMPDISRWYLCTLHHTSLFPPHPRLTIQSEAGGDFLGVAAQPIVARLLPQCAPLPHLYTVLSGGAFTPFPAHQLFRLLPGHMHACARTSHPHIHAQKSADAQGRAAGAGAALYSARVRRRHQIRLM